MVGSCGSSVGETRGVGEKGGRVVFFFGRGDV